MKRKKPIQQVFVSQPDSISVEEDPVGSFVLLIRGLKPGTSRLEFTDVDKGKEVLCAMVQTEREMQQSIPKWLAPADQLGLINGMTVSFTNDRVTFGREYKIRPETEFKLDSSKTPKEISFNPLEQRRMSERALGIDELKRDVLTFCFHPTKALDFPKDFETKDSEFGCATQ